MIELSGAMIRRGILPCLLVVALAIGLTVPAQAARITFWHDWGGASGEVLYDLVAAFEAANPDIEVSVDIVSGLSEQLLVAMLGGVAPDVVLSDRWLTSSYAARGVLENLDPFIERSTTVTADAFFAATWDEAIFRGASYGVPFNTDARALYYSERIFLEAGLDPDDPPSTWQDLRENAARVTRRNANGSLSRVGYVPHWGQPNFVHYLWQNGGTVFNEDATEVRFNGPEGLEVLEWMLDFSEWYGGVAALNEFSGSMVGGGPLASIINDYQAIHYDGNWNLGGLRTDFADFYADDLRVALPPMNTQRATLSGGFSFSIPAGKGAATTDAAWRFIEFMTSHPAQLELGVRTGNIPALRSAATDRDYIDDEIRRVFVMSVDYARFRPNHPAYPRIDEILRGSMQNAVLNRTMSPQAALEDAARQAQGMIDEVNRYIVLP